MTTTARIAPGIARKLLGRSCRGGLCSLKPTHAVVWQSPDVTTQYWARCSEHAEALATKLRGQYPDATIRVARLDP